MAATASGTTKRPGMASVVSTSRATLASAVATTTLRMPWATPKWRRVRTPWTST
jgi:hypothetical protein